MEIRVTLERPSDGGTQRWIATVVERPELRAIGATAEEAFGRIAREMNLTPPPMPVRPMSLAYDTPVGMIPYAGRGLVKRLPEVEAQDDGQMGLYRVIVVFMVSLVTLLAVVGWALWVMRK
jgi:hypothetical protein